MSDQPDTYAAGVRLPYAELPSAVTLWIELTLGGSVVRADDKRGGFSPGVAAVVETESGARAFVKAVGTSINSVAYEFHRREAAIAGRLPALPSIPGLIATTEIGFRDDLWSIAILPAVDGAPPRHPWTTAAATAVFDALGELVDELTPSPWPEHAKRDRGIDAFFAGWRKIAADGDDPWHRDPWVASHLDGLVAAEEHLVASLPGNTLTHRDLRADNVLVDGDHVWFVDWAHAGNAAAFLDPAVLLCDLIASRSDRADGGDVDIVGLMRSHPALGIADESLVWGVITSLAAALHRFSLDPAPPGLPTIRPWQRQQSDDLLRFAARPRPALG